MAREKKPPKAEGDPAWLVTFSDLVTLLLTFFVLLLSMSSMDKSVITKINLFTSDIGMMTSRGSSRVSTRIMLLLQLLERPLDVLNFPNRLKDLLFPDDVLPPEISRSTLDKNMQVLIKPEGIALVLSDNILFTPKGTELTRPAQKILKAVQELLFAIPADINISGYADNKTYDDASPYTLSQGRALSVLDFFVENGLEQNRFSVSAYGPNLPVAPNVTASGRQKNRRVEILVKTTPFFRGYQQF